LCRGDGNNSSAGNPAGLLTAGDAQAIFAEVGGTIAIGQPDFNESGGVTAADAQQIFGLITSGADRTCSAL
jgi:hypothetical protein